MENQFFESSEQDRKQQNKEFVDRWLEDQENRKPVWKFILRRIPYRDDAEDIFQNTIVLVYKKAAKPGIIIDPGLLTGFFYYYTRIAMKRHWQDQKKNEGLVSTEDYDPPSEDTYPVLDATELKPLAMLLLAQRYTPFFDQASERDQNWLFLHEVLGYTCDEIAAMEKPPVTASAVRKAIYRAKNGRGKGGESGMLPMTIPSKPRPSTGRGHKRAFATGSIPSNVK